MILFGDALEFLISLSSFSISLIFLSSVIHSIYIILLVRQSDNIYSLYW